MTTAAGEPEIIDACDEGRFVCRDGDAEAELIYHLNGHRLVLIHTEVPDALGGRGLGGRLATAALERAGREGLTIVPWCPFARDCLERHPDAGSRVTIHWESPRPARA